MGIAHTTRQGDRVALDDGVAVVERSEVIAVIAQGVADLLLMGCITCEICEQICHHRLFALLSKGRNCCHYYSTKECKKFLHLSMFLFSIFNIQGHSNSHLQTAQLSQTAHTTIA